MGGVLVKHRAGNAAGLNQFCGKGFALGIGGKACGVGTYIQGAKITGAAKRRFEQCGGNVNIGEQVVFHNAADGQGNFFLVIVPDRYFVTHLQTQQRGGFFRQDDGICTQSQGLSVAALMEVNEIGQRAKVGGDYQIHIQRVVLAGQHSRFGVEGGILPDKGRIFQQIRQLQIGGFVAGLAQGQRQLVGLDLAELLAGDDAQGISQAQSGQQQCGTAGYAQKGHKQAFFITEQIAGGDFPGKGKAPPEERDAFQQDAFAGRRCLGAHQLRGRLLQGGD